MNWYPRLIYRPTAWTQVFPSFCERTVMPSAINCSRSSTLFTTLPLCADRVIAAVGEVLRSFDQYGSQLFFFICHVSEDTVHGFFSVVSGRSPYRDHYYLKVVLLHSGFE